MIIEIIEYTNRFNEYCIYRRNDFIGTYVYQGIKANMHDDLKRMYPNAQIIYNNA